VYKNQKEPLQSLQISDTARHLVSHNNIKSDTTEYKDGFKQYSQITWMIIKINSGEECELIINKTPITNIQNGKYFSS
jgi:hypothetical protein